MLPAVDSYDGVVYKHFKGDINSEYLRERVRISSLLYGLLRPYDLIQPYRMEGFVRLAGSDERVDIFWRNIQTRTLIDDVNAKGGTLLYLASKEEQKAFHWREVCSKVRVIDFKFLQHKGDKLRQVVIYTKMARGEMIRYMMEQNIADPEELKAFELSGYRYDEALSAANEWVWVME
ncbi:MAG: peroxide stress protein YaaA [Rikenellaceae bacterium]